MLEQGLVLMVLNQKRSLVHVFTRNVRKDIQEMEALAQRERHVQVTL